MTAIRHSLARTLGRWASSLQQRRRRKLAERIMNDLPQELQRDIGWAPAGPRRRRL
ncbi:hypothetical protein [Chelativorans sp.]|uniref:hypothetical protein n=1 Tax=Chelativorans sp. TaxID=2203393 RepID=UPI002811630D|nr:hypothetical protein [Chelativorans sp.]